MGSGTKSYMRKGFLIYEEMRKHLTLYNFIIHMRRPLVIYDYVTEDNFLFFFISASADEHTALQNDNLRFFFHSVWPDLYRADLPQL
jgi:hypothetical protein